MTQELGRAPTAETGPGSVFISYSRRDSSFVHRLYDALSAHGVAPWVDWEGIPPAWDWLQEIYRAIEGADAFIFILSPHSVASDVCRKELDHAVSTGKRIVPVVYGDVSPVDVPSSLSRLNWIFMRDGDPFDAGVDALLQAAHSDPEYVHMHTALLQRARDWESRGHDRSLLLRGAQLRLAEDWLETAAGKDPAPTPAQQSLIAASRRRATSVLRAVAAGSVVIAAVVSVLAVLTLINRNEAVAQREQAVREREVAVARQISVESQVAASTPEGLTVSALLGAEGLRRLPTPQLDETVRNDLALLARPVARFTLASPYAAYRAVPSPNGQYVAAQDFPGLHMAVFDVRTGGTVLRWTGEGIDSLTWTPDSRSLLARTFDGSTFSLTTWDAAAGWTKSAAPIPRSLGISPLSFSPNRELVTGPVDRAWDAAGGALVLRRSRGWKVIARVGGTAVGISVLSPDGCTLAAGLTGIQLWNVCGTVHRIGGPAGAGSVDSLQFSPDGRYLVASSSGTLTVWDGRAGWSRVAVLHQAPAGSGATGLPQIVPGPRDLAAVDGQAVDVWEWGTFRRVARLHPDATIKDLAFGANGSLLAVACGNGTVRVWETARWREVSRFLHSPLEVSKGLTPDGKPYFSNAVNSVVFVANSATAVSASDDHTVRVWRVQSWSPASWAAQLGTPATQANEIHQGISGLNVTPDSRGVSLTRGDGRLELWPIGGTAPEATSHALIDELLHPSPAAAAALRAWIRRTGWSSAQVLFLPQPGNSLDLEIDGVASDGRYLVTGAPAGFYHATGSVISLDTGQKVPQDRYIAAPYGNSTTFGPDNLLGVVDGPSSEAIWNLASGKEVTRIAHDSGVEAAAYSPNGTVLATGDAGGEVQIWDVQHGYHRLVRLVTGSAIQDLAWSADGRYLAAVDGDGRLHVWDGAWNEALRLTGLGIVNHVAFSPNGKSLFTITRTGAIRDWIWRPLDVARAVCTRAGRNLTRSEWAADVGDESYDKTCPGLPSS